MSKYIFFIDVDDTLVSRGTFSMDEKISNLFKRVQNEGHIIAVVTGRALEATYRIKGIENAKYICGLMGSVVADGKTKQNIMRPTPMNHHAVKEFIEDINSCGLMWAYKDEFSEKTIYDADEMKRYTAYVVDIGEQIKDVERGGIIQLLVHGNLPQEIMDKYEQFDYFKMPGGYYDITSKGSSKEKAVEFLKGLHPGFVSVAIGDSNNDIAMFNKCEIKIAMGNANQTIKQMATHITKSVEECGVCYAIEEILNI